jgi:hypothetical protein
LSALFRTSPPRGANCFPSARSFSTALIDRIEQLEHELTDLAVKRRSQEKNLALVENTALRQRFQHMLDTITDEEQRKEMEVCVFIFFFVSIFNSFAGLHQ